VLGTGALPIGGARLEVELEGETLRARSARDGRFEMGELPPGEALVLRVEFARFFTVEAPVDPLAPGESRDLGSWCSTRARCCAVGSSTRTDARWRAPG